MHKYEKYEIVICWSDDDQVFIAEAPELPGCVAHGDTPDQALDSCKGAMGLWLDTAREFGRPIPGAEGGLT
jgi:predicted RNase H-like HicB family nuclease